MQIPYITTIVVVIVVVAVVVVVVVVVVVIVVVVVVVRNSSPFSKALRFECFVSTLEFLLQPYDQYIKLNKSLNCCICYIYRCYYQFCSMPGVRIFCAYSCLPWLKNFGRGASVAVNTHAPSLAT